MMAAAWDIVREGPRRDTATFDALYLAHKERVYRWSLRYSGGKSAWAEDLTHDVFLKLFEVLPNLRDTGDLAGWLYRVTANLAIERLRREQSIFAKVARLYRAGREETQTSAETVVFAREEAKAAAAALAGLPGRERVVLAMRVLDGKSQREIARELSLSEGYVSKLLQRAWTAMRAAGWSDHEEP